MKIIYLTVRNVPDVDFQESLFERLIVFVRGRAGRAERRFHALHMARLGRHWSQIVQQFCKTEIIL